MEEENRMRALLFNLIVAWENSVRYGQEPYAKFVRENPPPALQVRFEDLAELVRYNRERAEYEAQLDVLTHQREEFRERFLEAARDVMPILPEGAAVIFQVPDDWTRGDVQGNRYQIEQVLREGASTVDVKRLDD